MKTKYRLISKHKNIDRIYTTPAGAAVGAISLATDYAYQNNISIDLNKSAVEIEAQLAAGFDVNVGFEYRNQDDVMPIEYDYPVIVKVIEVKKQSMAL